MENTVGFTGINACGDESSGYKQVVYNETIVNETRSIQPVVLV